MTRDMFEGVQVTEYQAKLPSVTVDCDYYKHGTVLRLAVEVRVKGEGYEEDKEGNLIRQHKLSIQDIEVVSAFDPADANDQVGGTSAGGAPDPDDDDPLGIKTTADQWPAGVARTDDGRVVDPETGEVAPPEDSSPLDDQIEREVEEAKPEEPVESAEVESGEVEEEAKTEAKTEDRETADVGF